MEYTQKLVYQSNYWYNDGLKKAKIRDMTGAITSLKKSLQFNSENIAARNLLGLVYYGRGEVGEALVEWILSKNINSRDNIAGYYIQKIQESPADLDMINQAIRKYNQSLTYCGQGGEDLAIIQLKQVVSSCPNFLRAYQLLALLYLHTEQYSLARQALKEANKLDTTNELTLRYVHELTQSRRRRQESGEKTDKPRKKPQTVTYSIGNETIIQPASAVMKENTGRMTIINILIGLAVGIAFMRFLIMPAVNKSTSEKTNKQVVAFSDKIAEEEAQIAALKTELESFRATSEETESAQQTAASTKDSYEIVMDMYSHFLNFDIGDAAMVEQLLKVNPEALGTIGRGRYDEMRETLFTRYGETIYYTAKENFSVANYTDAVNNLTILMQMDEGYDNGEAMFLLSKAYEASGDTDNAKLWRDKVEKDYPNVDTSEPSGEEEGGEQPG
ncbi:MAG: hypothetical protein HFH12_05160 [Dorea sp.]|nr:hypothetical protein [Dorea sp.]